MAYDQGFAERVRLAFADHDVIAIEKKMMGGLCFMVKDKMCVGVDKDKQGEDRLMVRLDPNDYENWLAQPGARAMDFTGRPMKGFIYLSADAVGEDVGLDLWISRALDYNPKAKPGRKKARKK